MLNKDRVLDLTHLSHLGFPDGGRDGADTFAVEGAVLQGKDYTGKWYGRKGFLAGRPLWDGARLCFLRTCRPIMTVTHLGR